MMSEWLKQSGSGPACNQAVERRVVVVVSVSGVSGVCGKEAAATTIRRRVNNNDKCALAPKTWPTKLSATSLPLVFIRRHLFYFLSLAWRLVRVISALPFPLYTALMRPAERLLRRPAVGFRAKTDEGSRYN